MSGRTGSVTFVQRFGSAANLNLHAHVLVLDGVFAPAADRRLVFHPASPPEPQTLHELLSRVRARIARYLERTGAGELEPADGNDPVADQAPTLASCYAASLMGRRAFGARAGAKYSLSVAILVPPGRSLSAGTTWRSMDSISMAR